MPTQAFHPRVPTTIALVVLLLTASVGCSTGQYRASQLPTELQAPVTHGSQTMTLSRLNGMVAGSSKLAPGDLLHLTILSGLEQEEVVAKPARIAEDGTIHAPLIGTVAVANVDEQEAGERVKAASIERGIYVNPQVTVKVAQRAVNHVTVLGAVANPGTHEIPRGASNLVAALAAAGGLGEEAGTQIEVLRQPATFLAKQTEPPGGIQLASFSAPQLAPPEARTERIDLAMAADGRPIDLRLGDQDVVMVHPADKRVIHVAGLVRNSNQFEMPKDQDLHVLDAIAMAGGRSSVVADKVFVIRRKDEQSEPVVIQLSIADAKVNGVENIRLAPGDMVSVESTPLTGLVDTLSNVFRVTAGVGGNLLSF